MSRPLRIQYPDAWYHVMKQEDTEGIQDFYEKKDLPSILGTDDFIEKGKTRVFESKKK